MTAKYRGFFSPRRDNIAFMFGIGQEMRVIIGDENRYKIGNRRGLSWAARVLVNTL
jgi:hypothetical protein